MLLSLVLSLLILCVYFNLIDFVLILLYFTLLYFTLLYFTLLYFTLLCLFCFVLFIIFLPCRKMGTKVLCQCGRVPASPTSSSSTTRARTFRNTYSKSQTRFWWGRSGQAPCPDYSPTSTPTMCTTELSPLASPLLLWLCLSPRGRTCPTKKPLMSTCPS